MTSVGDTASITRTFEPKDVALFAELSGDGNPLHLDASYASSTPFGRPIVHGALVASLVSALLGTKVPGTGTIYIAQSLSFKRPVYVGEPATATVTVLSIRDDKPIATLLTTVTNAAGEIALDGEAVVRLPH